MRSVHMSASYDDLARTPIRSERGWLPAPEFVFGEPATRLQQLRYDLVSFFDLFRISRDEDAPPLALVFAKLAVLVVLGVAAVTLAGFGLGLVVARAFAGFLG
jgi:hypothetical protein